jgi:D-alanyl-D-alanine carboxypeptidase/D-alanyl-D-alanine-endopeptidase (penicillin-binding protein 4)
MLCPCFLQAQLTQLADQHLINQPVLQKGHIGISLYDLDSQTYLYNHQADRYFTPASTTKLMSMYAGMKCLPDSLPGIRYVETADTVFLFPTGDPTFLRNDFSQHPVLSFFKKQAQKQLHFIGMDLFSDTYGKGWSWDDQYESYMPELSAFPVRGNVASVTIIRDRGKTTIQTVPKLADAIFLEDEDASSEYVHRLMFQNRFLYQLKKNSSKLTVETPYHPGKLSDIATLLNHHIPECNGRFSADKSAKKSVLLNGRSTVFSQPTDTMLKRMMYESDNFLAEQTLLMAGATLQKDTLHTAKAITQIQKKLLPGLSPGSQWIDGSGLSRHNLFTPNDFVYVLRSMYTGFSWIRIQHILPTGGKGTLKNLYQAHSGLIYAKTGSMSNVVSLCGYLITKKNKRIAFSIIANQFPGTAQPVRKAIEGFLIAVRNAY